MNCNNGGRIEHDPYRPHVHICAMAADREVAIATISERGIYKVGIVREHIVGVVRNNILLPFVDAQNWVIVSIYNMESLTIISKTGGRYAFFSSFQRSATQQIHGAELYTETAVAEAEAAE